MENMIFFPLPRGDGAGRKASKVKEQIEDEFCDQMITAHPVRHDATGASAQFSFEGQDRPRGIVSNKWTL